MKHKQMNIESLHKAFLVLETSDDVRRFLVDLCTPSEIEALAERWAIACALNAGDKGYREIASEIGASTTTVARVSRFLKQENYGGYKLVISRLGKK